jgi:hypothetical protein
MGNSLPAILILSALPFTGALAEAPEVFAPAGKWNVNYEANQCVAGRIGQ